MSVKLNFTLGLFLILASVSCSHDPDGIKEVDTTLEKKGQVGDTKIGIKDDKVIIQEEKDASDALRELQWVNNSLKAKLNDKVYEYRQCRVDCATISGSEELVDLPDIEELEDEWDSEEWGLDEKGQLVLVSKQSFREKLKKEKQKSKRLKSIVKTVDKNLRACEQKRRVLRKKDGKSPEKSPPKGWIDDKGHWHPEADSK